MDILNKQELVDIGVKLNYSGEIVEVMYDIGIKRDYILQIKILNDDLVKIKSCDSFKIYEELKILSDKYGKQIKEILNEKAA